MCETSKMIHYILHNTQSLHFTFLLLLLLTVFCFVFLGYGFLTAKFRTFYAYSIK